MVPAKEVLTKLGMALYIHRALVKCAQKGKESVDYLREKGLLKHRIGVNFKKP